MIAKRKGDVARLFALARGSERSVEQTHEPMYKNRQSREWRRSERSRASGLMGVASKQHES